MKITTLTFALALMLLTAKAQTVYNQFKDGVVYFKIENAAHLNLPTYHYTVPDLKLFENFPQLKNIIENCQVKHLYKPFKTQNESVQNIYKIEFSDFEKVDYIVNTLKTMKDVEFAEKSQLLKLFSTPNDPSISNQWFLTNIQAYEAWDLAQGNANVKNAIVDDASRITHEDLAANVWHNPNEIPDNGIDDDNNGFIDDVNGWDAADTDNDPLPPSDLGWLGEQAYTHGTHCAGLAAGVTNNGIGIASVSYNVSYIPIKTVSDDSFFPIGIEAPAEGVDYAIAAGADIISMSFGGEDIASFGTLSTLIDAADDLGKICVAAAGNNGDGSDPFSTENAINYPAGLENVLAVAASDSDDKKTSFSQFGDWIDIMSPGASMYSTLAHSTPYDNMDGTSMACPLTAGALGLMKSYKPQATKQQLVDCLLNGADNVDTENTEYIGNIGHGRLNIYNSLVCLDQTVGVQILNNPDQFRIFPNPANASLTVSLNKKAEVVKILNITGQVVYQTKVSGLNLKQINLSAFKQGIYFVQIDNEWTRKLIIE
ncbi:MAG: S8 family peptidase [Bacteroidales bacterium]|nr:S8 family peptidase [Bacteroidales bacterium]